MSANNSNKTQPFLQWVGGKRKIADQLIKFLPSLLNNYYEPFLGGGALFFQVRDKFKQCYLSDINLELVTSYNAIKKNSDKVSKLLDSHKEKHSKEHYYQVRSNNDSNDPAKITARFIYLNRYSFKGIYRINIDGKPAQTFSGRNYSKSDIASRLKQCSQLLAGTFICAMDFSFIEPEAYYNKGISLMSLWQNQEAIENYDLAIKYKSDYADAYNNKGVALINLGKYQEAIKSYDLAINRQADYAESYLEKAITLVNLNKHKEAKENFNLALKYKPNLMTEYKEIIKALRKLGNDLMADEFEEKLKIMQDNL